MVRIAVIDLGTNSTRLLVADVDRGDVRPLERRSVVTRLGDRVDANGSLSPEAMERVYETLDRYRPLIARRAAERVEAVATSAVRDAANRDEFLRRLRDRFGFEARLLSGDDEARLTFLGATSRRTGGEPTLVVDVGGGSTELVVGAPGRNPDFYVSTQAGSVRQSERHLHHDPPDDDELDELRRDVRDIIESAVLPRVRARVTAGVAVAGTATSLAAIDQRLDPYDPAKVDGYSLRLDACERMLGRLAAVPLAQRREVVGLHPDRAPTIVAGAAILVEAMRAFDLERAQTSEADIMHGVAITATE
jgi:exopolyphosphatase / guanosine-5'-triphosphate,3'-diphosphate pyrophosphatase